MRHISRYWGQVLLCTLCGQAIPPGSPYWYLNGSCICPDCLSEFARQELAPYRNIRGEEEHQ